MTERKRTTALAPADRWIAAILTGVGGMASATKLALFTGDPSGKVTNPDAIAFGPVDRTVNLTRLELIDVATGERRTFRR